MKESLFFLADVALIYIGFVHGWRFIRRYRNYLLGLEWWVVGFSAANFLVGTLFGGKHPETFLGVSYFLDAFSRSFGITLILVLGLLAVTHHFTPKPALDIAVFVLAAGAAAFLAPFHEGTLSVPVATFYVVMNLLTTAFLAYFVKQLWEAGAHRIAIWSAVVTVAGCVIALSYDFFPWPFDDADRTLFYTAALATWAAQGLVYFHAYRALHDRNTDSGRPRPAKQPMAVSA